MFRVRRYAALSAAAAVALSTVAGLGLSAPAQAAPANPVMTNVAGPIDNLFLDNPADAWSGGEIVVGGQRITLPRNLLIDLPANRLALTEIFNQASADCVTAGESGLAAADTCSAPATGGFATITANRTRSGRVIAGDVLIEKGIDTTSGVVTFIDHTDGYYRLNGNLGDPNTGVMVRLNDPTSRHTVQQGVGCAATSASANCSPDPRFALDTDNYINVFSTGYPYCLPSTVPRAFVDTLNLKGDPNASITTQAAPDGSGDLLCPDTNRTPGSVSADSRRFAPVLVGDSLTASGNFDTVGGVRFLSAHTTKISVALETRSATAANQPDYMYIDEMFMDSPGFYRGRARDLFLGATTAADSDVAIWTIHRDTAGAAHEFPLGSVVGCDTAAGALQCRRVLGPHTFRLRHDVDFLAGAKATLNPCTQINADPRFTGLGICPGGGTVDEMFAMMSPLPREVQARTGIEMADQARAPQDRVLKTIDIQGAVATHGQYLFPMGIGLGGIETPNFAEIDINLLNNPTSFAGLPWTLDRRLSPTGCGPTGCENTAQPLDPYPFEGFDPRTPGALTPSGTYFDPNYTASALTNERDRMLSYVDPILANFNGDQTVLAWPPVDPVAQAVQPTPPLNGTNVAPIAKGDVVTAAQGATTNIDVLANDVQVDNAIDPATVAVGTQPVNGTATVNPSGVVSYTPNSGYAGPDSFSYTVKDVTVPGLTSNAATVDLTVAPPAGPLPTLTSFAPATGIVGASITLTGTSLDTVTGVTFAGGATQPILTNRTATTLVAAVPPGAVSGTVGVTSPGNAVVPSATAFTVLASVPTIAGFTPTGGPPGTPVVITGTLLTGATSVSFGGVAQTALTVVSPTQITTTVPVGAASGAITVSTPGGTSVPIAAVFTVATVHAITALTPSSGVPGTLVAIDGTGLTGLKPGDVTFANVPAEFSEVSAARVLAVVPAGAVTGKVRIRAGGNLAISPGTFTVNAVAAVPVPVQPVPVQPVPVTPPVATPAVPTPVVAPVLPPALAPAPPVAIAAAQAPTLVAPTSAVAQGKRTLVTGTAPAGSTVRLLARGLPGTAVRTLATTIAGPDRRFAFAVTLRTNATLSVQVGGGAATAPVVVKVAPTVSLRAVRAAPGTVRFTGTVSPARAGVVVSVYRRTAAGDRLVATTRSRAKGIYQVTGRAPAGRTTFVTRTTADRINGAGASVRRSLTVR